MNREDFYLLLNLYDGRMGRVVCPADMEHQRAALAMDRLSVLAEKGLITTDPPALTEAGLAALEPYRVRNAVILAAGASTRFIPLSLERPKGLFEVKGERLIERQIRQLREAGITDITVVLGYKKEMFFYLEEKYGVRLLVNDSFNLKNNIESIRIAREHLGNSYLCVSDSYFTDNPFEPFEYRCFNAGLRVEERRSEMYVDVDAAGRIVRMEENCPGGLMLLGHSFWTEEFAAAFLALADKDLKTGVYNTAFWEWMVKDHLDCLPPIYFKEYAPDTIFEFDFFEDLRKFDTEYLSHAHSEILRNIKLVFRCDEEDIVDFRSVSEGMTNTSFVFRIDGKDYIYRHPGDGTDTFINRRNEKHSLLLALEIGVDPTYVYADVNEGWKISRFISDFREPDYADFEDTKRILAVLRKLHASPLRTDYGLRPWEDALALEEQIRREAPAAFSPWEGLKEQIRRLYEKTVGDGVEKCFCHGDTYKPNWMLLDNGETILIDWEYSGTSDPGVDVGYYIVDAMYGFDEAERLIREYLGENENEALVFHYMAYTAIIAYYWFVWALLREVRGIFNGDALERWRDMAIRYAEYLLPMV